MTTPVITALSLVKEFGGESAIELASFIRSFTIAKELVAEREHLLLLRAILGTKLKDRVAIEFEYRDIDSFETLQTTLTTLFTEKRSLCTMQTEFNTCRQRNGESVRDYATRLEKLKTELTQITLKPRNTNAVNVALAESVNEQALNIFTIGLKEKLRIIIRSRQYDNLKTAITAAIEEEQSLGLTPTRNFEKFSDYKTPNSSGPNRNRFSSNVQNRERCHRQGHLAKNCYARLSMSRMTVSPGHLPSNRQSFGIKREVRHTSIICNYCKRPGHVQRDCRTLVRDNGGNNSNYRQEAGSSRESRPRLNTDTANIRQPGPNERTVNSYRINCTEGAARPKNIVKIQAWEIKDAEARMLVDTGADLTLLKYSKTVGKVPATNELITLRGIGRTEIPTICTIELNIKIGDRVVTHPCRIIKDDFPIQTDGILGYDFVTNFKAIIRPGQHVEILGVIWLLLYDEEFNLPPRTETIIQVRANDNGEGIVEKKMLQAGVYIGNCLTEAKNGKCLIPVINMTEQTVQVRLPPVDLDTKLMTLDHDQDNMKEARESYDIRSLTGIDRMKTLRDNIRTEHLNEEEKTSLLELCEEHNEVFYLKGDQLGHTDIARHKIRLLPNAKPVNIKPY
ncbi:uncharacterized protein LOC143264142 [Megachile rotundata]|uniref:uncharacterized protein LOC143264142 n=1 Tax=Megachile rotundata TaxID=143995 RepID=UPI003FD50612